jgi:hypothetical protein
MARAARQVPSGVVRNGQSVGSWLAGCPFAPGWTDGNCAGKPSTADIAEA